MKVGITGAEGHIGTLLRRGLGSEFQIQAVTLALNIETEFLLAYAISNNDSRIFDLTETNEKLGFFPADNSANY